MSYLQTESNKNIDKIYKTFWSASLSERNFWKLVFVRSGLWKHASTKSRLQINKKPNSERSFRLCIDSDKLHNFSIRFKPLQRATLITKIHLCQGCEVTCTLSKTQTLNFFDFIPNSGTVHFYLPSAAMVLLNTCNSGQHQKSSKTTVSLTGVKSISALDATSASRAKAPEWYQRCISLLLHSCSSPDKTS